MRWWLRESQCHEILVAVHYVPPSIIGSLGSRWATHDPIPRSRRQIASTEMAGLSRVGRTKAPQLAGLESYVSRP